MKKAEDFRQMLGPVDSGFHTVFHKTLEDLQQESLRKPARKRTALYPLRIRIAAAAAALALLAGAGILGLTRRGGGLDPADPIRGENRYTPQTIEAALAQGSEPETAGGTAGTEVLPARASEFDPEKDVVRLPGMLLTYACTLPDGRVVLSGVESRHEEDEYSYSLDKARLVCLNPDGTVSWEYTGPEEKAYYHLWFDQAMVLKDGTIAVKHRLEGQSIQFFSPDGNKIDKELGPFEECKLHPSFLMVDKTENGKKTGTEVLDWDGNLITRIMEEPLFGDCYRDWMRGDELVLYGESGKDNIHVKIVKMDGLTDKVLWETVLDYQWQDTDSAFPAETVKTEDGGYAVLVAESKYAASEDGDIERHAIVKLDADGHVQWVYKDDNQYESNQCELHLSSGKLVLAGIADKGKEKEINIIASWVDEEGKKLGTTELAVQPEWFAKDLGSMLEAKADSKPRSLRIGYSEAFSAPDGLKVYLRAYVGIYYRDTNELGG